jgi:hypothetical protein
LSETSKKFGVINKMILELKLLKDLIHQNLQAFPLNLDFLQTPFYLFNQEPNDILSVEPKDIIKNELSIWIQNLNEYGILNQFLERFTQNLWAFFLSISMLAQ